MTASIPESAGIFICYRREDAAYPAGWLFDRLVGHFGEGQVFKDVDSIRLGDDFEAEITAAVGSCAVLLAVIGTRWLTVAGEEGRRLDDPADFVRLEIETALTRGVRVIPVLVDRARMPRAAELPATLEKLTRRQALVLSPASFTADIARLLKVLDATLPGAAARQAGQPMVADTLPGSDKGHADAQADVPQENQAGPGSQQTGDVRGSGKPVLAADQVAHGIIGVTELISRTLGPMGRKCLVRDQSGNGIEAADAGTIVENFIPEDPRDKVGASYVRDMVREQHQAAYDGAATAAVLGGAMVVRAVDALRGGAHPASLKRGIIAAVDQVNRELSRLATDVEFKEQIASVATTSSGDPAIGEIIAEAMDKVGKEGSITVKESSTLGLELELAEGMIFDQGYISPGFVTDERRMEAVLEDSYILVASATISARNDLQPLLDKVAQSGKQLTIIAEDVKGDALATLVASNLRGPPKSIAVRAPGSGEYRRAILEDIAILTGGQVIGQESGQNLQSANLALLGRARRVVATRDKTAIVDGAGDYNEIIGRLDHIRAELTQIASTDYWDYTRQSLRERLANLAGGKAAIKVGAATRAELDQRKQRTESAIVISHEAVETGLLPGGGAALADVQRSLAAHDRPTSGTAHLARDVVTGTTIVVGSLAEPLKQIMTNADRDPDVFAGSMASWKSGTGFDVIADAPTDMLNAGIVDTLSAVSHAVANAASLTKLLLS